MHFFGLLFLAPEVEMRLGNKGRKRSGEVRVVRVVGEVREARELGQAREAREARVVRERGE
jgi:hypothetical protein